MSVVVVVVKSRRVLLADPTTTPERESQLALSAPRRSG